MNRAEFRRQARKNNKKTKIYTLTEEQIEKMRRETVQMAVDVSRAFMIAIPCNILGRCYWEKTAKRKIKTFVDECESLYESVEAGVISINELIQDTSELGNIKSEYFDRLKENKRLWEKMKINV